MNADAGWNAGRGNGNERFGYRSYILGGDTISTITQNPLVCGHEMLTLMQTHVKDGGRFRAHGFRHRCGGAAGFNVRRLRTLLLAGTLIVKLQALNRRVHGARRDSLAHVTGQQVAECKVVDAVGGGGDVEDLQNDGCETNEQKG